MGLNLKSVFAASICLIMLASFATLTSGQSGRKQKKADDQPPIQGVNQPNARTVPEPEVSPENSKPKEPEREVMISTAMPDIAVSEFYPEAARHGCIEEFRSRMHTIHISEDHDQHRSDAIKAAKESETMYVVYLELLTGQMASMSGYGFDLRYTVFEPKTAKIVAVGSGYPQQPSGPVSYPPMANRAAVYADWAGRDVAHQVMKRLGWTL